MTTNIYKPILYNTEMVQAILAGRKTQTRRLQGLSKYNRSPDLYGIGNVRINGYFNFYRIEDEKGYWETPKFETGDILWVRENWNLVYEYERFREERLHINDLIKNWDEIQKTELGMSTGHQRNNESSRMSFAVYQSENLIFSDPENKLKWKPSIHMPKEAARIFLKVTNVRCERLQDITFWDAIKEGVEVRLSDGSEEFRDYLAKNQDAEFFGSWGETYFTSPNNSFESLWDSINAKKSPWESNPWVWVYDFERIEKPENFLS